MCGRRDGQREDRGLFEAHVVRDGAGAQGRRDRELLERAVLGSPCRQPDDVGEHALADAEVGDAVAYLDHLAGDVLAHDSWFARRTVPVLKFPVDRVDGDGSVLDEDLAWAGLHEFRGPDFQFLVRAREPGCLVRSWHCVNVSDTAYLVPK